MLISRFIGKLNRLIQYLGLLLRYPGQSLLIFKLLLTNRAYLREWLRFSEARWLRDLPVGTLIDVGAYTGSLCFGAAKTIPGLRMFAFEPLPDNFAALQKLTSEFELKAFNVAVGNEEGEKVFYQNSFSASSSALPMAPTHVDEFPDASEVTEIRVPFWRLDNHVHEWEFKPPVLLVLDVQGYEFEVLKGAIAMLAQVDLIICEISVDELYEHQASFEEIYSFLRTRGFSYCGNFDALMSPNDGRLLQMDAIFKRIDQAQPAADKNGPSHP